MEKLIQTVLTTIHVQNEKEARYFFVDLGEGWLEDLLSSCVSSGINDARTVGETKPYELMTSI